MTALTLNLNHGLRLLPRDMLKIGRLVRARGVWDDSEVVSLDWPRQIDSSAPSRSATAAAAAGAGASKATSSSYSFTSSAIASKFGDQ